MRLGELTIPRLLRLMLRPVMRPMHRWWIRRVNIEDPREPVTSFMIRPALFGATLPQAVLEERRDAR